jgi:hypothetical protein
MPIDIINKMSFSKTLKIGALIVVSFIIIAFLIRINRNSDYDQKSISNTTLIADLSNSVLLVPAIYLDVNDSSLEKYWTQELANKLKGQTEVSIENGRIDVITETYAIEVDFIKKWKEGLGQAIHYGKVTGKIPTLALITQSSWNNLGKKHIKEIKYIDMVCIEKGIKLILLDKTNR